jgi:ABC-type branched-subunit amino acid transport system permease subunit
MVVVIFYNLSILLLEALRGVREMKLSMKALGKNVNNLKIYTFAISSAFIAVSGFLYATYVSYIDPTSFNLDETIFILSALIVVDWEISGDLLLVHCL